MQFSSDRPSIFLFLVDKSGSMENDVKNMISGLAAYKKSFENFPESNSIVVSVCQFNARFYPGEFNLVKDMEINYNAYDKTALYRSIVYAEKYLTAYTQEIINQKRVVPRVTFMLLSDGLDSWESYEEKDAAKNTIQNLNYAGVTTVFIAFGEAISSHFGEKMGFMATIDVKDRKQLTRFLGEELSEASKEQSRSMKSLGANFFSQATSGSSSQGYSQTTTQALEDTAWIDDI